MNNKNIFFVVVIGYNKDGNKVACNNGLRNTVVKFEAMPLKVNVNSNFATELGVYYIAQYCETYKRAVELAECWNDDYKSNGSIFEFES